MRFFFCLSVFPCFLFLLLPCLYAYLYDDTRHYIYCFHYCCCEIVKSCLSPLFFFFMATPAFTFGYELRSKQVRAYQLCDLGSVRRAITANLQEYLVYEGVVEEDPTSLGNLFLKVVTICGAAGIYAMSKSKVSGVLMASSIAAFAGLVVFQYVCGVMQHSEDVVFVGTGKPLLDPSRTQKQCFKKLKDQRLLIKLWQKDTAVPVVTLEAQIVGESKLFSPPIVYSRTEQTVQYGQFFGSTGFFFPPPLIKLVDSMLDTLMSKKQE